MRTYPNRRHELRNRSTPGQAAEDARPAPTPRNRSKPERVSGAPTDTPTPPTSTNRSKPERVSGAPADTSTPPTSRNRSESERVCEAPADTPTRARIAYVPTVTDQDLAHRIYTALARLEIGTVHRIQAIAPTLGLTAREFLVLTELIRHHGLGNSQITGITGLPSATVAELLTGLEARGLVTRVGDPVDRRGVVSFASAMAEQRLDDARGSQDDIELLLCDLLRDLDVGQLSGVCLFLDRAGARAYRTARLLRGRRSRR